MDKETPRVAGSFRVRKLLLLVGVATPLAFVAGYLAWLHTDDALLPDDDLHPPPLSPIADDENGLRYLEEAVAQYQPLEGSGRHPLSDLLGALQASEFEAATTPDDTSWATARQHIEANQNAIERLHAAARRTGFRSGVIEGLDDPLYDWDGILALQELLRIHTRVLVHDGHMDAALDNTLLSLELGRRIAAEPYMVECIVGIHFQARALADLRAVLAPVLSEDALVELLVLCSAPRFVSANVILALQHGYYWRRRALDNLVPEELGNVGKLPSNIAFKPHRTANHIAENQRQRVARCGQEFYPGAVSRPKTPSTLGLLLSGNAVGEVFIVVTHVSGMERFDYVLPAERAVTRVALALRIHRLRHGELPATLDELAPAILPEIPQDPFTGAPLVYDRERGLLYSVGDDQQDDGGDVAEDIVAPLGR